jgi:dTDP-4-dehydrorhamnose reductase
MRVVLVGSQGQVGWEIAQVLNAIADYEIVALNRSELDFTQTEAIVPLITQLQPDIIINAAAYTAVDKAESEPDLAFQLNAVAPQHLAKAASQLAAALVHISTDYVFDGHKNRPYQPEDPTHPLGVYGQSKLAGEKAIQTACDRHAIVRTAWVYGTYGKANFVKTMLRLGADREQLRVVYDQLGSPTWAFDLASAIVSFLPHLAPQTYGLYHYTNSGVISWYDFAMAIFEEAEALGLPLQVNHIEPITSDQYPTPAVRPAYSVLSGQKLAQVLGKTAPYWRTSLRKMLQQLVFQQH